MQSLQMRCPVAAAIGLSMVTMASAPIGIAVALHHIHLGDFLFERAAGERDAEDAGFERAVFFFEAGGAAILALVVALDAVVGLVERAGEVGAGVGELEAFAIAPVVRTELQLHEVVSLDRSATEPGASCRACAAGGRECLCGAWPCLRA